MDSDILDMENTRLIVRQGDRVLIINAADCPCCGKKQIVIRLNGEIALDLKEAKWLVKKIEEIILVAKSKLEVCRGIKSL